MRAVIRSITVEGARCALNLDPTKNTREAIAAILDHRPVADHARLYDACEVQEFDDLATANWQAVSIRNKPDTFQVTGYLFDGANMIDAFDWELN